tara:strand:- start:113 stop:418 length:306 start_codon:yes stop_codon:yes gene_type:complete
MGFPLPIVSTTSRLPVTQFDTVSGNIDPPHWSPKKRPLRLSDSPSSIPQRPKIVCRPRIEIQPITNAAPRKNLILPDQLACACEGFRHPLEFPADLFIERT